MSVPKEEKEALSMAWEFLFQLLAPKETPGVPLKIRKTARQILRHYPGPSAIEVFWKNG